MHPPEDISPTQHLIRAGLASGLLTKEEVIDWADKIITNDKQPDIFFIDLALSSSKSVNDLIHCKIQVSLGGNFGSYMHLSSEAQKTYAQIPVESPKLGDLKKIAKAIRKNHELAMELWSTGEYFPRLLATQIMDNKLLSS